MFLGDTEVFRTSTAEPTTDGIIWTYVKEMSQYNTLWKQPQKLIFDLGSVVNDVYTGPFNTTLTAYFSHENNVQTADIILPISAKKSSSNSSSAFSLPSDSAVVNYTIPSSASRAVLSISACGQSDEEFWWSNVFSSDTEAFNSTVGELYGYSPFREVQLYIDGVIAGVVWPFPIIFTGGVVPGFWRPIVGIDTFDLRQPEIDISAFLPQLTDGESHTFEVNVVGLDVSDNGTATLSKSVGSSWVVTGTIFLYTDSNTTRATRGSAHDIVVDAPAPKFNVTRHLVQNKTGGNDSLSYSVEAERRLTISSPEFSWTQRLSFSNFGLFNQQGYSQVNDQKTVGENSVRSGNHTKPSNVSFQYPLWCNTTYGPGGPSGENVSIDAIMKRGLNFVATDVTGISTYTLTAGPSWEHTTQAGEAHYQSDSKTSTSSGNTTDDFESFGHGKPYSRHVKAVNGSIVGDTDLISGGLSSLVSQAPGRDSIRSILGRGPRTSLWS